MLKMYIFCLPGETDILSHSGTMVNVLKFQTLFLFLFHKMLVRITNREDPDQTVSSEAV